MILASQNMKQKYRFSESLLFVLSFLFNLNSFVYYAIFPVVNFIGFCEWINFYFSNIMCARNYHFGKKVCPMRDTDFSQLLFIHLEKREYNNVYKNLQQNVDYLEATSEEASLCEQYENLNFSEEQRNVIKKWTASIHAQNAAYTSVVFPMGMQCCFTKQHLAS